VEDLHLPVLRRQAILSITAAVNAAIVHENNLVGARPLSLV